MTILPRCDFHIHTKHLGCANGTMEVPAIVKECERLGVQSLALTDHLNTLEKLSLHECIRQDIEGLETDLAVFFGVELSFLSQDGPFPFSAEIKEKMGFQFAIGGIHETYQSDYNLQKIVEVQHRHHLKVCRDPLVDVLAHPYCFSKKGEFDKKGWPWFDTMKAVPASLARELGQTAKETGTAIEINGCSILTHSTSSERFVKEYIEFLAIVAGEGARFSLGSDAHAISRLQGVQASWQAAKQLGLTTDRIWRPTCRPMAGHA